MIKMMTMIMMTMIMMTAMIMTMMIHNRPQEVDGEDA